MQKVGRAIKNRLRQRFPQSLLSLQDICKKVLERSVHPILCIMDNGVMDL